MTTCQTTSALLYNSLNYINEYQHQQLNVGVVQLPRFVNTNL